MVSLHDILPRAPFREPRRKKTLLSRAEAALFPFRGTPRQRMYGAIGAALFLVAYFAVLLAPGDFSRGTVLVVKEGMTLGEVAVALEKEKVIRSPLLFQASVMLFNWSGTAVSGDYFFNSRPTFFEVARRIAGGLYGIAPVRVTIPEGADVHEIALLAGRKLDRFDAEEFEALAKDDEGYLFPDTYHFLPNATASEVRRVMRENFDKKLKPLAETVRKSGKTMREVITMASLLEEEARQTETRRLIAGILWKRLDIGMPLQVDATFLYINGKNTFELTLDDLADDSSPYNTYAHKGLPPGPISNPGLDSIVAALYPKENPYLYYLADLSGTTHYSRTFDEHKEKKFRYLP